MSGCGAPRVCFGHTPGGVGGSQLSSAVVDSTAPGPAIEIRGLRVRRGESLVIPDLSMTVRRGIIIGLLGPSGSGKTTLMRAMVGVQRVEAGTLMVLGMPAGTAEARARVGYVTQAASVYDDLTVDENISYFGDLTGASPGDVDDAILTVGLCDHRSRVVGSLSGGQRSRVSLASALVAKPELLVLDEPTVGLDPLLRRELWGTFRELAGGGTTLVVSSHVMDEADECDSLSLMREGRIIAHDTPDGLRERTGRTDLGAAFVELIRQTEGAQ